jgi:Streptomyces sporulation and cell division protein, SsgA
MSVHPDMVTTEIDFRLVGPDGPDRPVHANLTFVPSDPYAVRVGFHTGSAEIVEWTFARSLLSDGVTHPVGDGDVQVWPTDSGDHAGVCLALSSPSGQALFEAPLIPVVQFLTQTYAVVPTGAESGFIDVDAELASLLKDDR